MPVSAFRGIGLHETNMRRRYLVTYDIPEDRKRLAVSRLLTGFGIRVQWSVFECCLNSRELRMLMAELIRKIDPDTDRIAIYECGVSGTPRLTRWEDHHHGYWIG